MKASKRTQREARQLFRLCIVGGVLDEGKARQVVDQVVRIGQRGSLALLSHFLRLVREDDTRRRALVESAAPLPQDLHGQVEAGLAKAYGQGLMISYTENPALIGGMKIRVGSDVYDGSIRARLAALEQSF